MIVFVLDLLILCLKVKAQLTLLIIDHQILSKNHKKSFIAEIKEMELMSKRLNKCIASFDSFDKPLIALSATSGSISIASFNAYKNYKEIVDNNTK